jgi:predicted DCC family thiol-disulfide oxidoreductase YuxK
LRFAHLRPAYKLRKEYWFPLPQAGNTLKTLPTLVVWYNTKCPVCNAGIDWQSNRLIRAARAGAIEFRDINIEPGALLHFGAGLNDVRRRLHAVDADGRLYVGADCAIAIWLRTPGDAWLGHLIGLPGIRRVARVSYDLFANLLFAWNRRKGHW